MLAAFRIRDAAIASVALLATTSSMFAAEGPATQPEQAGFSREGIQQKSVFKDGTLLDSWLYAKLR